MIAFLKPLRMLSFSFERLAGVWNHLKGVLGIVDTAKIFSTSSLENFNKVFIHLMQLVNRGSLAFESWIKKIFTVDAMAYLGTLALSWGSLFETVISGGKMVMTAVGHLAEPVLGFLGGLMQGILEALAPVMIDLAGVFDGLRPVFATLAQWIAGAVHWLDEATDGFQGLRRSRTACGCGDSARRFRF
ncbi:MAG: hypothetical protein FD153_1335 [Rhodospirillaceae bacterium]|nr:MAG: hypothetical protein FD153_1335 [Rhodospirillaceae bacterium]